MGTVRFAGEPRRTTRPTHLTACLAFAVTAMATMQTSSIALLPVLPGEFGTDVATVSWVATATLIAGAVANPIAGRLGDIRGKHLPLIGCVACAVVGSLVGAGAVGLGVVIAARALQGVGAGAIPLSYGIVRDEVPAARLIGAISIITAAGVGIGAGLGPVMMGVVVTAFGWRAVFWVTGVWSIVALALLLRIPRGLSVRHPASFDWIGALLLSGGLVTLLLGITKGASWGWTSPRVAVLALAGAGLLGAFWRWESTRDSPLVDLRLVHRGGVEWAHLGGVMVGFAAFAQYVITFTLVTAPTEPGPGLGRSVAAAGLVQVPGAIALGVSALAASRWVGRFGAARLLVGASLLVAVGFVLVAIRHDSLLDLAIDVSIVNLGLGVAFSTLPIMIVERVPAEHIAAANAVNGLCRVVGSVLASALVTAILATGAVTVDGAPAPAGWTYVAAAATAALLAGMLSVAAGAAVRRAR